MSKNSDIVELIIKGEDEYSSVSEGVKGELSELSQQAASTRGEMVKLDRALDLTETYKKQEAEVNRLSRAQAEAKIEMDRLKEANKQAKVVTVESTAALAKATAEHNSLRTATNRAQRDFQATGESIRKYGISIDDVTANQKTMRAESDGLAKTYTELSKKQTELVSKAQDQVQATKDQEKATAEASAEAEKALAIKQKQIEADKRDADEKRRVKEASEKLTTEIKQQVSALEKGEITWEDYKRRVNDAGKASDLTGKQVAEVNRAMEGQVTAAKQAVQANKEQAAETDRVKNATATYRVEMQKLIEQYKQRKITGKQFEAGETEIRNKLKLTEEQVKQTRTAVGGYTNEIKQLPKSQTKASKSTDALTKVTRRLAQAYTVLLAAKKASALVTGSAKAYAEEETAMLGLKKTTELTAAELSGLTAEFTRMSGDVTATTVSALLEIAESAGRMGIEGSENILAFTKATDALASATGLAATDTAQAIAQILNVTGEALSNVGGVAAAIADLGNKTRTTEDQIIHFAKRMASDTATFKLSSAEVLGMGAGFAEMGNRAEGASSVIGRSFRWIEDAIVGGGDKMAELSRITGKTSEELIEAFGQDKVGLLLDLTKGMAGLQEGGVSLNTVLEDMGMAGDGNARILGLMGQIHEKLRGNIATSNKAFAEGTAHLKEHADAGASLANGFERLKNRADRLKVAMGEAFSDDLSRAMDDALADSSEIESAFAEVGEALADVMIEVAGFIGTLEGVDDIFKTLSGGIGIAEATMQLINGTIVRITGNVHLAVAGFAILAKRTAELFGMTEAAEKWAQVIEDSFDRAHKAQKRMDEYAEQNAGRSSRAWADLKQSYEENADALEGLDEEQRKALETIIKSTGYIEGFDDVYRDLTRTIDRASASKKILEKQTSEESELINTQIRLLQAQGKTYEEAAAIAKKAAEEKRQALEKEKEAAEATTEAVNEKTNTEGEAAKKTKLNLEQIGDAVKRLEDQYKKGQISQQEYTEGINNLIAASEKLKESAKSTFQAFSEEIEKLGTAEALNALAKDIESAFRVGEISADEYNEALYKVMDRHRTLQGALDKTTDATKKTGEAAKEAAKAAKEGFDDTTGAARAMGGAIAGMINATSQRLAGMSQAAASYWQSLRGQASGATDEIGVMLNRIQEMDKILSHNRLAGNADIGGWGSYFAKEAQHAFQAEKAFLSQKIALEKLLREYEQGDTSAQEFSLSVEELERRFNFLDKQDLNRLKGAVRSVENQVDGLRGSLESTISSLRQELASLQGDTEQVEQLRQAEKKLELEEQYRKAQASGDAETLRAASEALSLLDQTHKLRMAQVKEQADARREEDNRETRREELERQRKEVEKREQAAKALSDLQTTSSIQTKMVTIQLLDPQGRTIEGQFEENQADAFLKLLEEMGRVSR